MKFIKYLAGFCALALTVAACNTIEGAGQDIERAGDEIEDATN